MLDKAGEAVKRWHGLLVAIAIALLSELAGEKLGYKRGYEASMKVYGPGAWAQTKEDALSQGITQCYFAFSQENSYGANTLSRNFNGEFYESWFIANDGSYVTSQCFMKGAK